MIIGTKPLAKEFLFASLAILTCLSFMAAILDIIFHKFVDNH